MPQSTLSKSILPKPTLVEQQPAPADLNEVPRRLRERYLPTLPAPRRSSEPLDALIGTILSQQNTSIIARRQFAALKASYPQWEAALADGPDGIEGVLRNAGGGLARVKADYIHNVLYRLEETRGTLSLQDTHDLNDAEARALLESLPGVGMKTASLVLLFNLARPAMPVDTHIGRVAARLEWVPARWNAVKVERWFDEVLPRDWASRYGFHVSAIRHGRETCRAQRPLCGECVLQDLCPSAGVFLAGSPNPDQAIPNRAKTSAE